MNRLTRYGISLGAACVLALAFTGSFWAQDKKTVPANPDVSPLRDSLKDVANTGAELFNKFGDHAGCYRLYQGALLAIKPFVAPAVQVDIDTAVAEAEKLPRLSDRAFALRKTIDLIRAQAGPIPPITDKKSGDKRPAGDKPAIDKKVVTPKTLWERLGGEANVRKVVVDFTKAAATDPNVNFSRDNKFKLDEPTVKYLENQVVDFISSATDGPFKYQGKNMRDAHRGMGITNAEYDATSLHLQQALEKNGVRAEDAETLMKAVAARRKDIVEAR
jgi:hemoglobin